MVLVTWFVPVSTTATALSRNRPTYALPAGAGGFGAWYGAAGEQPASSRITPRRRFRCPVFIFDDLRRRQRATDPVRSITGTGDLGERHPVADVAHLGVAVDAGVAEAAAAGVP